MDALKRLTSIGNTTPSGNSPLAFQGTVKTVIDGKNKHVYLKNVTAADLPSMVEKLKKEFGVKGELMPFYSGKKIETPEQFNQLSPREANYSGNCLYLLPDEGDENFRYPTLRIATLSGQRFTFEQMTGTFQSVHQRILAHFGEQNGILIVAGRPANDFPSFVSHAADGNNFTIVQNGT